MNDRSTPITIAMKPKSGKHAKNLHPWIFSNEIEHRKPFPEAGTLVHAVDERGQSFGMATYNPHSLIALRLLCRYYNPQAGNMEWFVQRFENAQSLRRQALPQRSSYRLIHSEADGVPGLIVDRYENHFAVQVLTAGMERLIDPILNALHQTFQPESIVLRNDSETRKLEGLESYVRLAHGSITEPVQFQENQMAFYADLLNGQKTGHFFDQAENRKALANHFAGSSVLDLFCYTGAWGCYLLETGAGHVTFVDRSREALQLAQANIESNRFSGETEFHCSDVFSWLKEARQANRQFDCVIVDPPAFAKNSKQMRQALRGYEDLNRQALHLVRDGGLYCTCSCTQVVDESLFLNAVLRAAVREKVEAQLLEIRGQAPDHPILLAMPESRYLKCLIARVWKSKTKKTD